MSPIDRSEFRDAIAQVREDIRGVHSRLDVLNGRTLTNERALAKTDQDVALLEQRVSTSTRWRQRVMGSAAAAAVAIIVERLLGVLLHR